MQSLHKFTLELVSLHSQWQNKPTCLEAGLVNQTLKEDVLSLINLKNHGKQLLHGHIQLTCKKYTKVPHSGKAVWTSEPCTLFRLQSVRRHAQSHIHEEATRQEIAAQLSANDGGISEAFQHCWEAEEKALVAAMSCVFSSKGRNTTYD